MSTNLLTHLTTRESIRNLLFQPQLSGVAQVFDVTIVPQGAELFSQYVGTNYDVSAFLVKYRTAEQRTS